MATLYFKVASDWEEVVKLRTEVNKLEAQLKSFGKNTPEAEIKSVENKLRSTKTEFIAITTEAAKAGAAIDNSFKKKIFDASQSVNGFTEKIIAQKNVIKEVEFDVRRLGEAYREAKKNNPIYADGKLNEWKAAKKALEEEKAALFALTQERANAQLSVKKLRDEYSLMKVDSAGSMEILDEMTNKLKGWGAKILGGIGIKEFIGQMVQVRGEFQAADTAIQTLLGSKEKADALMSQVREYAKISPLEFSDVTAATQMMLGFNIEAEKVPRFLQAIGDVSMGDAQKFNSLTLAFSQMSATGKLMGQDLNQMINAGFNPLQSIAEKTGKSMGQLKDEMSKGAISAEMVQQAFIDATSAGGKFYQMSENASKTINGQLSMMQDAIDTAFNEMGQKSEGFIMGSIQMTTKLIENYETVGKVLAGLIVTYGVYKAALITNITLTRSFAVAARVDAVAKGIQTAATNAATVAQAAFNAVAKANPYVFLATAVVGLGAAMWAFHDSTTAAEAAQNSLNEATEAAKKKEEEHKQAIEALISASNDENLSSKERQDAMNKLIQRYPSIIKKYIDEEGHLREILKLKKEIAEVDGRQKTLNLQKGYENDRTRLNFLNKLKRMGDAKWGYLYEKGNENLLQWYQSMQREARKTYGGFTITFDEVLDFYENRTNLREKDYKRNITETKIDKFSQGLGNMSTEELKSLQKELMRANKNRKSSTSVFVKSIGDYLTGTDRETLLTKVSGMVLARERSSKSNSQKTKSELDEDKKKLKQQLEAMTAQEAAGKKGLAIQKKIKAIDEQLIKFDVTGKNDKKAEQARKKAEREEQKRNKAETKSDDETLKLRMENRQAELDLEEETTEKKLKLIDISYDKQKAEIAKKERELAEQNKKAGTKGLNEKGLTDEQQTEIDKAHEINEKSRRKQISDAYNAELQSMRDYLKEYGTFQQQKLAIAEEYADKIAKAGTEGEKLSLAKQRDVAIREKSDQKIINRVDWVSSFGKLGNTFDTLIKNALEELNAYIQTDEFKSRTADEKKTILDARNQLQGQVSNDATFEKLNKQINEYRQKLANLSYYENSHALAIKSRMDAEQARDKIEDKGSKEYEEANRKVILSKELEKSTAEELISSENAVKEAQDGVADTAQKLNANLDNFSNGLNQLTSGTLSGTVDGLTNLFKSLGLSDDIMKKFKDTLKNGLSFLFGDQIGGMLADSLDVLQGFLTGDLQEAIISAVTGMIDNILQGITKGGIITKPIKALVGGLQGIVNTITFGGLNSWLRSGSNAREVAETMARLTERNEKLTQAIDNLRDTMDKTAGRESIAAYEEAYKYQKEIIENQKEKAKAQAGYHNQHHSWASYMGWSPEMLALASNITGINFTGTESLWELSPEQMQRLLGNMTISDAIASAGKGGYGGRVLAQLQEYAEYAGSLEDLTKQINESITQISFDSLRDNFMSTLMDMESGAKDFAEDWREIIQRAMLNFALGDQLDEELKKLYQKLSDTMQTANGHLTESQIEAFAAEYDALAEKGIQIRDEIAAITGYKGNNGGSDTSGGSGSKGYTATASQDSIDRVDGRVTGIQICCEQIRVADEQRNERLNLITAKLDDIIEGRKDSSIKGIAEEMRDVAVKCYMELQQIGENTSESSKLLSAIRKDINDIKKNL